MRLYISTTFTEIALVAPAFLQSNITVLSAAPLWHFTIGKPAILIENKLESEMNRQVCDTMQCGAAKFCHTDK
jgi:hypothetical protein